MENLILILAVAAGIVVGVLLFVKLMAWASDFSQELWLLNCEIQRTEGEEQRHWKRKKRRLWLSLLPFVRY